PCVNNSGAGRVCSCGDSPQRRQLMAECSGLGLGWHVRKIMIWCGGLALAGVVAGGGQPAVVRPAGDSWGKVIELPGLAALDKGGWGRVEDLACSSAGNCVAGGHYGGKRAPQQGFVAIEKNGHWGRATGVPGLPALNASGFAATETVSCPSAHYCAAGGYYGN